MMTYFIYKCFIYDVLIDNFLFNGDCIEQALGLIGTIFFGILGLLFIIADIILIPLYLLLGIIALIFKIVEVLRK